MLDSRLRVLIWLCVILAIAGVMAWTMSAAAAATDPRPANARPAANAHPSATAGVSDPRLAAITSWAFAIGDNNLRGDLAERYAGYGLVVVDGEEATRRDVARIRSTGAVVLAYLDVGAIERGRWWYPRAKRYRLDYWRDWGEWYADVGKRGYRDLLVRRVAPRMLAKRFDGLFVDNVDMLESHRRLRRPMTSLVGRLARLVHRRGGYLFAQNGAGVMRPMVRYLDGWNREDVGFTYDFERRRYVRSSASDTRRAQGELRRMRARGLLTLATSYTRESATDRAAAAALACVAGAIPFVSNIGLTRVGSPLICR